MHAFNGPDRVGWWVNDPTDTSTLDANRLKLIAAFAGGMISDVFAPPTITKAQVATITKTPTANPVGTLRFQLRDQPIKLGGTPAETPQQFAQRVHNNITRLSPGTVDLDIELNDDVLAGYMRSVIVELRKLRPTFLLRPNIDPNKIDFLPVDLIQNDPNLFVAVQTYYGDMARVGEWKILKHLERVRVPADKVNLCIGAAARAKVYLNDGSGTTPWKRVAAIPDIAYADQIVDYAKVQAPCLIFSDGLAQQVGLVPAS
jgi:hypothetical protein